MWRSTTRSPGGGSRFHIRSSRILARLAVSDPAAEQGNRERVLSNVDLFSTLSEAQRADLASATVAHTFGDGEAIVRQGEPGHSMYVLCSGRVAVVLEPGRQEVAVIEQGG